QVGDDRGRTNVRCGVRRAAAVGWARRDSLGESCGRGPKRLSTRVIGFSIRASATQNAAFEERAACACALGCGEPWLCLKGPRSGPSKPCARTAWPFRADRGAPTQAEVVRIR